MPPGRADYYMRLDVNDVWRNQRNNTYGPLTDARYDPKTLIAMDRIIHMGSGAGTFGVKTEPTRWDGVKLEREGRRRLLAHFVSGAWRAVRPAQLFKQVLRFFDERLYRFRIRSVK